MMHMVNLEMKRRSVFCADAEYIRNAGGRVTDDVIRYDKCLLTHLHALEWKDVQSLWDPYPPGTSLIPHGHTVWASLCASWCP